MLIFLVFSIAATPQELPSTFDKWVQERVGPVVYPEKSAHTWDEFTGLAKELGTRAVKTWVGGEKPGEALDKMKTEPYRELYRTFHVVHVNVSLSYIANGYDKGKIAPEMLDALRKEWHDITLFLCGERAFLDQVFLLSVGGELNVYLGTANARPDFPIAELVNTCHAGKEAALAELPPEKRANVFSVAEIQGDIEYDRFAEQWTPQFETDLVSLSYYTFYRPLKDALDVLRRQIKPLGPFGANRLMLGEYGPSLEVCNWNQAEHLLWHDEILRTAFAEGIQYAFFYEIADHDFVITTGSHDGLITWAPGPLPRLAWDYYRRLYHGLSPTLPDIDVYEVRSPMSPSKDEDAPNLAIKELGCTTSALHADEKASFTATVANTGKTDSQDTTVNFFVNDRLVSWVWIPALKPGQDLPIRSDGSDARLVWRARPGTHRVIAIADGPGKNQETSEEDNTARITLSVEASSTP